MKQRRLVAPIHRVRRTAKPEPIHSNERVWFFDLDNTLHDASHAIFPRIDISMNQAVMAALDVDTDTANTLRKRYWSQYGATVIGLERHHGVNAEQFLQRSHDFDIAALLKADKGLVYKLRRLPGRKVLLTNAPMHYARTVLKALGIEQFFSSLWAIEQMRLHGQFSPKPSLRLMRYVLAHEGVSAHRAVLVEDTLANLRSAKQLGMRTIYIQHQGTPFNTPSAGRPAYVDVKTKSISDVLLRRR